MWERLQPCYGLVDRLPCNLSLGPFSDGHHPGEGSPAKVTTSGGGTNICWIENISRGSRLAGGNPDDGNILPNSNLNRRLLEPLAERSHFEGEPCKGAALQIVCLGSIRWHQSATLR